MKRFLSAILVITLFASCEAESNKSTDSIEVKEPIISTENYTIDPNLAKGFQLLQTVCFSCHSPNANEPNKVAPTMASIKLTYLKNYKTEIEFKSHISTFIQNPQPEISIVNNAPETYGIMPKFEFSELELNQITAYLYQSEIEKDNWFTSQFENETNKYKSDNTQLSYVELGKKFALSTKSVLGKNLKGAIKSKGTTQAVSFCNEKAYSLTDSMAIQLHAGIKRVSDQPRNSENQANQIELEYILESKIALSNGEKVKPKVQELNGKMVAYYPITTNAMCMQCHGTPNKQIIPETLTKINALYPNDLATGYDENELRGIWVVEMNKK